MGLLAPLWLLLGLLGLLVVWLHLRRWSRRILEVSSTYLWRRLLDQAPPTTPRKPPPLDPLLLLQLLVVLLLALALAKPVLGLQTRLEHTIYVLDASGSMQATDVAPSRFAQAKSKVRQLLSAHRESLNQPVSLVVASSAPWVAAARQSRNADLEQALSQVEGTGGTVRWDRVGSLVQALQSEGQPTRVVLLSDGTEPEALKALAAKGLELQTLQIAGQGSNVGFSSVQLSPPAKGFRRTSVSGEIRQFGSEKASTQVEVYFHPGEGSAPILLTTQKVPLARNRPASFQFFFTLPGAGVVELRLPEDHLSQDNRAFFVLRKEPLSLRVLQLGQPSPPIERALQAIPGVELFRADKLPEDSRLYDLVMVGREIPRHPQTSTLWLGVSPTFRVGSVLPDPYPSGWRQEHPLSRGVNWAALEVNQGRQFPRLAGAEVLLEASGSPLVQARSNGYGREVVLSFALDQSNWASQPAFPAFMLNLVRWIAPSVGSALYPPCQVGVACGLDVRLLAGDWQLLDPQDRPLPLKAAFVGSQAGDARANQWLPRSMEQLFRPLQAGVYTLVLGGSRFPVAVNAFGPESDIRPSESTQRAQASAADQPLPLWTWLLLLALGLLLLEAWLAGRRFEGFLIWSNLLRRNPLATRRRWMLALQGLAVLALLLAASGMRLPLPLRESAMVILADHPELYRGRSAQAIQAALQGARASAVVWLGAPPRIAPASHPPKPPADSSLGSDLEAALSLAAGVIPPQAGGRVVLVADGLQTQGQAAEALGQLAERGIRLDVLPVGGIPEGEVFVEQLILPSSLHAGDTFMLRGILYSQQSKPATLRILRQGQPLVSRTVNLLAGRNRVEVELREPKPGTYRYDLELGAAGDVFGQNNRQGVLAQVGSASKIALFTLQEKQGRALAGALAVQGLRVELKPPSQAPKTLEGWAGYQAAVLMNVPAIRLSIEQQKSLETWVKDQGGGLLILGGENSFGPGGYYRTALDRLSPLSSKIPQEAPKVAMLFVLDKSGSMNQPTGDANTRRVDVAREAILEAIGLLHPQSLAGVVVFDTREQVLVPVQSVQNRQVFQGQLERLQTGGGTSLYPALVQALAQMRPVGSLARHVIILSDGLSDPGDFETVVGQMAKEGITLSTVAIGEGADVALVEKLARLGGGASHITTDWQALPGILAQEALLLSATPVKRDPFVPAWANRDGPLLQGWPAALPPLGAYVQTTLKPQASLHLIGPRQSPLLASWRYGLGQVVAFASQGAGPWAAEWARLPQFPLLWAQVLHQIARTTAHPGLNLQTRFQGDEIWLSLEALQEGGSARTGLPLQASLTSPSGETQTFPLAEVAPGRYEALTTRNRVGEYRIEVAPRTELDNPPQPLSARLLTPYAARYAFDPGGSDLLTALAATTGGKVLLGDEPLTPPKPRLRWQSAPAWPLLACSSLAFFLLGLMVRYWPGLRPRSAVRLPHPPQRAP